MVDSPSPLLPRRRLGSELRTARQNSGLTQSDVTKTMEWSLSKINRIEQSKSGISANDLRALLRLYNVTSQESINDLVALAREARKNPWWQRYRDVAPPKLLELMDYESAASTIKQFETTFVPGILQTEEYASAVLQVFHDDDSERERVNVLVDLRTRRRSLLASDDAPKFYFVLDESVVKRLAGGPTVMRRQLESLIAAAKLPNVTMQIVPFQAGLHPGMKGPFELVEFDDTPDGDIVFYEEQGGIYIKDDRKVTDGYRAAFKRIRGRALSPSDSVGRLTEAIDELA
jgi:transcriptional regulator with XRE-family HTH domain